MLKIKSYLYLLFVLTFSTSFAVAKDTTKEVPLEKLLTGDWERHKAHGLEYRVFGERKIRTSKSKLYPLVIYLHGKGGNVMKPEKAGMAQFFSEKSSYRKNPCLIIVPQAPTNGWGDKSKAVIAIANEWAEKFPIDKNRIYITGYSMGGFGTFSLIAEKPDFFAAGAPIAGGASPRLAKKLKNTPLWVFHGEKDNVVGVERSRNIVQAIKKLDGKVTYTEIKGGTHGIGYKIYKEDDMRKWLFEQKKEEKKK